MKKAIYKNKIRFDFLISYFLILLVPLSIITYLYSESLEVVKQDTKEYNLAILEQAIQVVDTRLSEINLMAMQLASNPKVTYFKMIEDTDSGDTYYKIWELKKEFAPYYVKYNFITEMYIYFHKSNLLVSTTTSYPVDTFYGKYMEYEEMDYYTFKKEILDKVHNNTILPSLPVTVSGWKQNIITYLQTLPIGYNESFMDANIIILINEDQITRLLDMALKGNESYIYISDIEGNIITSISSSNRQIEPLDMNFTQQMGFEETKINGQSFIVSYMRSSYNNWVYVVVSPSSEIMHKVDYIKHITVMFAILAFTIGVLGAVFFTYRNSKPIRKIVSMLYDFFGDPVVQNEYTYLEGSIAELIHTNQDLQSAMEKHMPILRDTLFDKLLKGEFTSLSEIHTSFENIGIKLEGELFQVIFVGLKGFKNYIHSDILKELEVSKIVIKNSIQKHFGNNCVYQIDKNESIILLVKFDSKSKEEFRSFLEENCIKVYEENLHHHKLSVNFSVSGVHSNLTDIYLCYNEALLAYEYREFMDEEPLMFWFGQLPGKHQKYYYTIEFEARLISHLKSGKHEEVDKALKSLYHENFEKRILSQDMKKALLYELYGTIVKLLDQFDFPEEAVAAIQKLDLDDDYERIYNQLTHCYNDICLWFYNQRQNQNSKLIQKIISYISESYSNPDFSLSAAAMKFNISEAYLSVFFKDNTGDTFSAFLENVRMNQASTLLINTDLSIQEIAIRSGYHNDKTFRRAFKRVKGMSPKEFRDGNKEFGNCNNDIVPG